MVGNARCFGCGWFRARMIGMVIVVGCKHVLIIVFEVKLKQVPNLSLFFVFSRSSLKRRESD